METIKPFSEMTIREKISCYIYECLENRSSGFQTDFGIKKLVSTHVYYYNSTMVVTIVETKQTKGFDIVLPEEIIDWIYSNLT